MRDYVLTGGELAAMVVADSVGFDSSRGPGGGEVQPRGVPSRTGHWNTRTTRDPGYSRNREVPPILLRRGARRSGSGGERSRRRTLEKRPDLLEKGNLSEEDRFGRTESREEAVIAWRPEKQKWVSAQGAGHELCVALVHYPVYDKKRG